MKTLLAAVLVLLSLSVQAEDTELTKEQKLELLRITKCKIIGESAYMIMTSRQRGQPLFEQTDLMLMTDHPEYASLIIEAYKERIWNKESDKKMAISVYSSKAMLSCLESK